MPFCPRCDSGVSSLITDLPNGTITQLWRCSNPQCNVSVKIFYPDWKTFLTCRDRITKMRMTGRVL